MAPDSVPGLAPSTRRRWSRRRLGRCVVLFELVLLAVGRCSSNGDFPLLKGGGFPHNLEWKKKKSECHTVGAAGLEVVVCVCTGVGVSVGAFEFAKTPKMAPPAVFVGQIHHLAYSMFSFEDLHTPSIFPHLPRCW